MSETVAEWDEEPATGDATTEGPPAADVPAAPQLFFGSVDEFVREKLRYTYARRVGPQSHNRWDAQWWRYPEAISRLDAMWRAWEALRLEGTFGMSAWWRDHADHHMRMLLSPEGPFASARSQNADGEPLPYEHPPLGMFVDVRTLPQ